MKTLERLRPSPLVNLVKVEMLSSYFDTSARRPFDCPSALRNGRSTCQRRRKNVGTCEMLVRSFLAGAENDPFMLTSPGESMIGCVGCVNRAGHDLWGLRDGNVPGHPAKSPSEGMSRSEKSNAAPAIALEYSGGEGAANPVVKDHVLRHITNTLISHSSPGFPIGAALGIS
jgi:hypothetical protein